MAEITTNTKAYDLTRDETARREERKWLDRLENRDWLDFSATRPLSPGVSVIIPSYKAFATISKTIRSLSAQTLSLKKFEIIIVCNGDDDGTAGLLDELQAEFSDLQLKVLHSPQANAGGARNLGMLTAKYEFTTFVDADDFVEPNFLQSSLDLASNDQIVVNPIVNLTTDGIRDEDNSLNQRISQLAGSTVPLAEVPWVLGFNACKLVATQHLSNFEYRTDLKSGEDIVYFANLLTITSLKVKFLELTPKTAYVRVLRGNSVSRQDESFDFNVRQRVDCISALQEIHTPREHISARRSLEAAQAGFIQRYLIGNPEDSDRLEAYLGQIGFISFPWEILNKGKAKDLAISYCFSPYSDTSAVVAAKAIAERRLIVDVISNDLSNVRQVDPSLSFLSSRWIDQRSIIDAPASFSGWPAISQFATKAFEVAQKRSESIGAYQTLYSRALWVGSHVAAALFKKRHIDIYWTAEFSDPLRFGVEGEHRPGEIIEDSVSRSLRQVLDARGYGDLEIITLFDLVEASSLVLADDIIFTNPNQMEFILSHYPKELSTPVRAKSRIRAHPTPSPAAYFVAPSGYVVDQNKINIGFFGSFYVNRGLGDLFTALFNLRKKDRGRLVIHIFCNEVDLATDEVRKWGLEDVVKVNPYLPYMNFLNAATKFEVLLVNDIERNLNLNVNPFLPSKLSDYRGAGAHIWGLIDEGSPLSREQLDFRSPVGNSRATLNTLQEIIEFF